MDKLRRLRETSEKSDFWDNPTEAAEVMREIEKITSRREELARLRSGLEDLRELLSAQEVSSAEELELYEKEARDLAALAAKLERETFLAGEYDAADAIVSIYAGAGGDDAQDWAEMLLRMLIRFAERKKWKTKVLSKSPGAVAGIKSATVEISGENVYGLLSAEAGTHRLVRLSPFNSDNLRQTSFARVEVLPLVSRSTAVEISPGDIRVDTFRSSGAGGQSVNTTDSAVRVTHLPTGISATCQNERSQLQNKEAALRILRAKLLQKELERQALERAKLRGENISAEWGSQIRSYVLHPYKMVKDHRTGFQTSDVERVLDGDIDRLIEEFLRFRALKSGAVSSREKLPLKEKQSKK